MWLWKAALLIRTQFYKPWPPLCSRVASPLQTSLTSKCFLSLDLFTDNKQTHTSNTISAFIISTSIPMNSLMGSSDLTGPCCSPVRLSCLKQISMTLWIRSCSVSQSLQSNSSGSVCWWAVGVNTCVVGWAGTTEAEGGGTTGERLW